MLMKNIMKERLSSIKQFTIKNRNYIATAFVVGLFAVISFSISYGYFYSSSSKLAMSGQVGNIEENNQNIKFYVETGYQSGIYSLSSKAPTNGYTLNKSKSEIVGGSSSALDTYDSAGILDSSITSASLYFDANSDVNANADIVIDIYRQAKGDLCINSSGTCSKYLKTQYTLDELANLGYYYNSSKTTCTNSASLVYDNSSRTVNVSGASKTTCSVYFTYGNFASTILNSGASINTTTSTIESDSIATTDEGLIKTTDEFGDAYIFRGAITTNYVKFAGYYWRIMRINGDGSVRIIYWGSSASSHDMTNNLSSFNSDKTSSSYVGFYYDSNGVTNGAPATVIKALENFYITKLSAYDEYIGDSIFCNDRTVSSSSGSTYTYGKYLTPSSVTTLKCPNFKDSFNTVSRKVYSRTSKKPTYVGNYELKYPIGLVNIQEIMLAGGRLGGYMNGSYYLENAGLTMSPASYSSGSAKIYVLTGAGRTPSEEVTITYNFSPVISLKADVRVTGKGTASDPYVPVI